MCQRRRNDARCSRTWSYHIQLWMLNAANHVTHERRTCAIRDAIHANEKLVKRRTGRNWLGWVLSFIVPCIRHLIIFHWLNWPSNLIADDCCGNAWLNFPSITFGHSSHTLTRTHFYWVEWNHKPTQTAAIVFTISFCRRRSAFIFEREKENKLIYDRRFVSNFNPFVTFRMLSEIRKYGGWNEYRFMAVVGAAEHFCLRRNGMKGRITSSFNTLSRSLMCGWWWWWWRTDDGSTLMAFTLMRRSTVFYYSVWCRRIPRWSSER